MSTAGTSSDVIGRRKLEDEWNRFLREIRGEAYVVDMRNGLPSDEAPAAEDGSTPPNG